MSNSRAKYQIVFQSSKVERGWQALHNEFPDRMKQLIQFLKTTPEDRLKADRKLKKLKGCHKGKLQYDVTYEARVWYRVDRNNHTVIIKYAGPHP